MKVIFNITENKNKATFQQEVVKINTSFNQTENIVKPKFQIGYYPLPYDLENYYTNNEVDVLFNQTYNYINNSFVDYNNTIQTQFLEYYTKIETNALFLNYYTKTELDTNLSTKLDKGTYTGTASDLFLNDQNLLQSLQNEQSARYYADQSLENSKQNKLETVSGNTGVGKTDASATEKLDIAGRSKSDGQVFNETTSAILPREIKFKDGNFVAAGNDGVEKKILREGEQFPNTNNNFGSSASPLYSTLKFYGYNNDSKVEFRAIEQSQTTLASGMEVYVKNLSGNLIKCFSFNYDKNFISEGSISAKSGTSICFAKGNLSNINGYSVELYGMTMTAEGKLFFGSWKDVILHTNFTRCMSLNYSSKSVNIGNETAIDNSCAILTLQSTNKGFLLPRMTKAQRNAIATPLAGLMIWQIDSGNSGIRVFDGTNWNALQTIID